MRAEGELMKLTRVVVGVILLASITACSERQPKPNRVLPPVSEIKGRELARIKLPANNEHISEFIELGDEVEYIYVDIELENARKKSQGGVDLSIGGLFTIDKRFRSWMESEAPPKSNIHHVWIPGEYEVSGTSWHTLGGGGVAYLVVKDVTEFVKEYDPSAATSLEDAISILQGDKYYYATHQYIREYLQRSGGGDEACANIFFKAFHPKVKLRPNEFSNDLFIELDFGAVDPWGMLRGSSIFETGVIINGTNTLSVYYNDTIRSGISFLPLQNITRFINPDEENSIRSYWKMGDELWQGEEVSFLAKDKYFMLRLKRRP